MFMRVIGVLASVACCLAYPSGAPETACQTFTPKHPGSTVQQTRSPYSIRVQGTSVRQGATVQLTVAAPQGMQFEGFMIQARNPQSPSVPIGNFTVVPPQSKTLQCGQGGQNTITHESKVKKTTLNFAWQPPAGYVGSVVFRGTVLQDYATYWVGVQSPTVQVVKSG